MRQTAFDTRSRDHLSPQGASADQEAAYPSRIRPIPNRHTAATSIVSICPRLMVSDSCMTIASGGTANPNN